MTSSDGGFEEFLQLLETDDGLDGLKLEMLANNTLAEGNPTSMTLNCGTPPASAPRPMHLAPVGVDEGSRGEQSE
ncbi:hypothetical protein RJ035_005864 [Blastomyces gilchristii]